MEAEIDKLAELFIPGTVVQHKKTLGIYTVIAIALRESDTKPMIVYQAHSDGIMWVRELSQFIDGRFVPVDP